MIFAFFSKGQIPNSFLNLSGSVSYTILRMPACCLPCTHTHTHTLRFVADLKVVQQIHNKIHNKSKVVQQLGQQIQVIEFGHYTPRCLLIVFIIYLFNKSNIGQHIMRMYY